MRAAIRTGWHGLSRGRDSLGLGICAFPGLRIDPSTSSGRDLGISDSEAEIRFPTHDCVMSGAPILLVALLYACWVPIGSTRLEGGGKVRAHASYPPTTLNTRLIPPAWRRLAAIALR